MLHDEGMAGLVKLHRSARPETERQVWAAQRTRAGPVSKVRFGRKALGEGQPLRGEEERRPVCHEALQSDHLAQVTPPVAGRRHRALQQGQDLLRGIFR